MKSETIESYQLNYKYIDNKSSISLVFIHGFLGTMNIWDDLIRDFPHSVLLIDLPGHGESNEVENLTFKNIAFSILELINQLNIKKITLIGHSLGGYIVGSLAKQKSSAINKLILINSSLLADSESKKIERNKAIRSLEITKPIFSKNLIESLFSSQNKTKFKNEMQAIQQSAKSISKNTLQQYLIAMRDREESLTYISNSKIPILYISSKKDKTIPFDLIPEQVKKCKGQLTALNNSGHMSFIEEKKLVTTYINSFLLS